MDPFGRDMLMKDEHNVRVLQSEFDQLVRDRQRTRQLIDLEEKSKLKMNLPVNIGRLIQNAHTTMGKRSQMSNLSPITIIDSVRKLQDDLTQLFPSYHKGFRGTFSNELSHQRV